MVNASILYNIASPKPLSQLEFRLAVVAGLLKDHHPAHMDKRHLVPASQLPLRLTERAFPEPIPTDTPYGIALKVVYTTGVRMNHFRSEIGTCRSEIPQNFKFT